MSSAKRRSAGLPADFPARLKGALRQVVAFRSLSIHPPAPGSEPFFDGMSLSFPLKRGAVDLALVVLDGVERPPDLKALAAACGEVLGGLIEARPQVREPALPTSELHAGDARQPRVLEVLPLGKLVIEAGEGMAPGQRLLVWEPQGGAQAVHKAEAEVLSVQEGRAVARIVSRGDPFMAVRPGDLVAPAQERDDAAGAHEPTGSGLAAFRAILDREGAAWERLAVLVARLEGAEVIRTRFGTARLEKLLADMGAALLAFGGQGTIVGREGADLVLAAFPGKSAAETLEAHAKLVSVAAGLSGDATAGCTGYPAWGFERAEAVGNALKALEHARLLGPGKTASFNAVSLNVSGDALYAKGDLEGAAAEYVRALTIDSEDTNVLNSLGVCYANLGRLAEAREQFRLAIAARPNEAMAHYNLGYAHLKQGEQGEALKCFQAASEADATSFEARFQLGKLLLASGRLAEAREHLKAAAAIEQRPYLHRYLADCLLGLGESAEAAQHYKRAVRANPEDAHCLSQLAAIYLEQGSDLEVAVSLLGKAVEVEPESALHRERLKAALARLPEGSAAD